MSVSKRAIATGIKHVKSEIPALAKTIEISPKFDLLPKTPKSGEAFESLVDSVISQQISTSAAATISARVKSQLRGRITPLKISRMSTEQLRDLGVSGAKARTIHELAEKVLAKDIHLTDLAEMQNEQIVEELSSIWGIGRWTAEMFLMFDLGRLDVWPVGDFGVRKGWQIVHSDEQMLSQREFESVGHEASPFRSIAAWYCWRAIDLQKDGRI